MMMENKKCCSDCQATQTPLWRSGPAGPKSLCNACGIRYRKKGNPGVNWSFGPPKRKKMEKKCGNSSNNSTISTSTTTTTMSASSATGPTSTTTTSTRTRAAKSSVGSGNRDLNESKTKVRLVGLAKEVVVKRSPAVERTLRQYRQRRTEWGEVEQAAVCLLAMSCGSVFG